MTYPNAYTGIKKIFNARIIALIGAILLLAGALYFMISTKMITSEGIDTSVLDQLTEDPTKAVEVTGLAALPIVIGAILLIVWFIMELVGLSNAGKDEGAFRSAFWAYIICIIASLAISIATSSSALKNGEATEPSALVSLISTVVTGVLSLVAEVLIVKGIQNLAAKLNRADMVAAGKPIIVIFVIGFIINLVCSVLPTFIKGGDSFNSILTYVGLAGTLLSVIAFFVMLGYLAKAKRMLAAA